MIVYDVVYVNVGRDVGWRMMLHILGLAAAGLVAGAVRLVLSDYLMRLLCLVQAVPVTMVLAARVQRRVARLHTVQACF